MSWKTCQTFIYAIETFILVKIIFGFWMRWVLNHWADPDRWIRFGKNIIYFEITVTFLWYINAKFSHQNWYKKQEYQFITQWLPQEHN